MFGRFAGRARVVVLVAVVCPLAALLVELPSASAYAQVGSNPLTSWCSSATSATAAVAVAPATLVGSATETGVTVAGVAATDATAPVVLSALAFAASYCGTTALLHWVFGASHTVETSSAAVPTTTTTYGAGCFYQVGYTGAAGLIDTTHCGPASAPASGALYLNDGYAVVYGSGLHTSMLVGHAPVASDESVAISVSWDRALTGSGFGSFLYCKASTSGVSSPAGLHQVPTGTGAAGTWLPTWSATACSGALGAGYHAVGVSFYDGTGTFIYYFGMSGAYPGYLASYPVTPAPTHKMRFELQCTLPDGSVVSHVSLSGAFTEDGTLPPIQIGQCPAGIPTQYTATEGDSTGTGGTQVLHWTNTGITGYPQCAPGGTYAPCLLDLRKQVTTNVWDSCTAPGIDCTDFNPTTSSTATYECLWGPYTLTLPDCADAPKSAPAASTSTGTPTTGSNPSTGNFSIDQCLGSGWTWDPKTWVYVPITCALQWAFVPTPGYVDAQLATLQAEWAASPPGTIVTAFGNVFGSLASIFTMTAGDCHGPALNVGPVVHSNATVVGTYPFSTCDPPQSDWVAFIRPIMTALVYLSCLFICTNLIAGAVGFRLPWQRVPEPEQLALF